jgi:hypothetical protein
MEVARDAVTAESVTTHLMNATRSRGITTTSNSDLAVGTGYIIITEDCNIVSTILGKLRLILRIGVCLSLSISRRFIQTEGIKYCSGPNLAQPNKDEFYLQMDHDHLPSPKVWTTSC